jgi:hypothetical protein
MRIPEDEYVECFLAACVVFFAVVGLWGLIRAAIDLLIWR